MPKAKPAVDAQPRPTPNRRHNKRPVLFKTEAEMCKAFTARAERSGWDVYPETAGWDLLLVWRDAPVPSIYDENLPLDATQGFGRSFCRVLHTWDPLEEESPFSEWDRALKPGMQLGIQAKMHPNVEVLAQAIERWYDRRHPGPDFRGLLVPHTSEDFNILATRLGLRVFVEDHRQERVVVAPRVKWRVGKRLHLPPIKPSWSGGEKHPRVLSEWRVRALRICILLQDRGWVTKADFIKHQIEHRTWVARRWIEGYEERVDGKREYRYRLYPDVSPERLPIAGYEKELETLRSIGSDAQ